MANSLAGTAHNETFYLNDREELVISHEVVLILSELHHFFKEDENGELSQNQEREFTNIRFEITKNDAETLSILFAKIAQRMDALEQKFITSKND